MDKNPTLNQSKLDQFSNHLSIRNSKPNILFIFNSQIADYNAAVAAASKQHLICHFGRSISKLILTTAVVDLKVGRVEGGVQQGVEWYAYIATCACRTCTTTTMMVPKNGSVQRITYIYTSTSLLICAQRAHERNGLLFFFLLFMLLRSWVVPMAISNGCFVCIPGLCRLSLCALCVLPLPGRAAMANHDIGRPACSCAWHSGEWNTSVTIALSSCCCCFCCLVDTRDVVGVVHLSSHTPHALQMGIAYLPFDFDGVLDYARRPHELLSLVKDTRSWFYYVFRVASVQCVNERIAYMTGGKHAKSQFYYRHKSNSGTLHGSIFRKLIPLIATPCIVRSRRNTCSMYIFDEIYFQ